MNPVNHLASVNLTGKMAQPWMKSRETWTDTSPAKKPCLTAVVKEKVTTATLDVPGVEVVESTQGKAFAGPFYPDQLDLLRDTLRGMPRREQHIVVAGEQSLWIHRKP